MWSLARGFGRRAELRVSADLRGACAIGFGQPVIVVADTLVDALTDDELDQVVMHEHAPPDAPRRLGQSASRRLIAVAPGLHPAVRWLGRIDLEREAACDDHVVRRTGGCGPTRVSGDAPPWRGSNGSADPCSPPRRRARIHAASRACCACSMPAGAHGAGSSDGRHFGRSRRSAVALVARAHVAPLVVVSRGGNRHPRERRAAGCRNRVTRHDNPA